MDAETNVSSAREAIRDWTGGAAKWAAVAVLGGASVAGVWHGVTRNARTTGEGVGIAVVVPEAPEDVGTERAGRSAGAGITAVAKVDLNAATAAELELLPGVGPATAAAIVEYRTLIKGFRSVDELDGVKGIGKRTIERLRPLVTVGPSLP